MHCIVELLEDNSTPSMERYRFKVLEGLRDGVRGIPTPEVAQRTLANGAYLPLIARAPEPGHEFEGHEFDVSRNLHVSGGYGVMWRVERLEDRAESLGN